MPVNRMAARLAGLIAAGGLAAASLAGCGAGRFVPVSPPGKVVGQGIVWRVGNLQSTFTTREKWLRLTLKNLGGDPLRLLWDGALYVDQLGRTWPFRAYVVKGGQGRLAFLRPRALFGDSDREDKGPYFKEAPEIIPPGRSLDVYLIPAKNIWPEVGLVLKDRQERGLPIPRLNLPGQTIRPMNYGPTFSVILIVEGPRRTTRRRFTFRYRR